MAEHKPKLLIVEDDEGLQAQLKWAYDDFDVVMAGDRASAIAALRAEEPPVVTLDLGLPPDPDGTSEGFAILDEIMALKPDTKVIVASGHGARESALTAIERGAYDFYRKPVDIEQLGLIVRRALNLHRIEAACIPGNVPSIRVLEKCGFTREGLARRYLCINGIWQDHLLFGMLHEDFRG